MDEEQLLEVSLEGGAEFYEIAEDEMAAVFTEVANLENLSRILKEKSFRVIDTELRWIPDNYVEVTDPDQSAIAFEVN